MQITYWKHLGYSILCGIVILTDAFGAGLPVVVRVKDNTGKAMSNIIVATDNLASQNIQLTTDGSGIVRFANKCVSFKNAYNPQTKQGVKICATDKSGVYQKTCVVITNKSNCEPTIQMKLAPRDPNKKYPSPEQMSKYALNASGNKVVYPVCDPSYTKYPSAVTKHCVDDFFRKTDVQMMQGVELAKIYVKQKFGHDIVCGIAYRPYKNDDYLQCTSKDAKHVYEFRFNDLNESVGNTIQNNTADALCRLPDGTYYSKYTYCQKGSGTKQICGGIDQNAQKFGWSAAYYDSKKVGSVMNTLGNGQTVEKPIIITDVCQFDFNKKTDETLNKYPNLDSYVFKNIQVQSNRDTILLITQYVRNKLGSKFKSLQCNSGFSKMNRDGSALHTDDVITCHLTTADNQRHDVDFVFDDINETNKTKTAGGLAGMNCIANNGQFDGKQCVGIGKIQCKALNYQLKGGTTWDDTLGLCKMKAAQDANDLAKFENGMKVAGTVVVGVALTLAAPGGGAAMWVALTATSVSAFADGTSAILQDIQNERARDFIVAAHQCGHATTCDAGACKTQCNPGSVCAKNTLLEAYKNIKNILTTSPTDQLTTAVSDAHDTILEKISPECVDAKFKQDINDTTNALGTAIEIADWTSLAADVVNIASATKSGGKIISKIGSKASKFRLGVKSPKALKVLEKLGTVDDIRSASSTVTKKTASK